MKNYLLALALTLPLCAFANVSDTVCDVDGFDVSFDIGSKTPQDSGSRTFDALEVETKGNVDKKGVHQILNTSSQYLIVFNEHDGDFFLKITSKTKHKLIFSAEKKTAAAGTVKTSVSSSIKGYAFPHTTFTCHR